MPVEIGFCDICKELECEDPEQCDLERQAIEEEEAEIEAEESAEEDEE